MESAGMSKIMHNTCTEIQALIEIKYNVVKAWAIFFKSLHNAVSLCLERDFTLC